MKHCQHVASYPLPIAHQNLCSHCQVTDPQGPSPKTGCFIRVLPVFPTPTSVSLELSPRCFLWIGSQSFRLLVGVILQVSHLRDTGFQFYPSHKLYCSHKIDFPISYFLCKQQCSTLVFKGTWKHFKLLMPKRHTRLIASEFLG